MNYFYDLLVNPQEEFLEFYEWEKKDTIVPVKKVPVFKVSEQVIFDFLKRNITLSLELTMKIKDKTIIKNTKEKISGLLLTDGKTSLFIEFDDLGQVIYRSKLLVEDENNINEVSYSMKEEEITYQIGEALPIRKELRKLRKRRKELKQS